MMDQRHTELLAFFDVAITEWKAFLSAYPNDPQWQTVQARIVSKLGDVKYWYQRDGRKIRRSS